jgi:hypothetical protein
VNQNKQQEAIDTIPWPAMSPDMNPIEHVWDCIGTEDGRLPTEVVLDGGVVTNKDV